jgi:2-C-methyl-D-erythritol 4-phosphate cytidylyltransferase
MLRSAAGAGEITVVGVPVSDTIKEVRDGLVRRTIPRETLADLRGPWLVNRDQLLATIARAQRERRVPASVVDLCRNAGLTVRVIVGPAS